MGSIKVINQRDKSTQHQNKFLGTARIEFFAAVDVGLAAVVIVVAAAAIVVVEV